MINIIVLLILLPAAAVVLWRRRETYRRRELPDDTRPGYIGAAKWQRLVQRARDGSEAQDRFRLPDGKVLVVKLHALGEGQGETLDEALAATPTLPALLLDRPPFSARPLPTPAAFTGCADPSFQMGAGGEEDVAPEFAIQKQIRYLAHELSSPLNSMLGWLQLLEADKLSPDEIMPAIRRIRAGAQRQKELLVELRRLANSRKPPPQNKSDNPDNFAL